MFTEADIEKMLIEQAQQHGWKYVPADEVPRSMDSVLVDVWLKEALLKLDEQTLLDVFDGVPHFEVDKSLFENGVKAIELTTDAAAVFASKGEMRKLTQGGGVSINKEKLADANAVLTSADLLDGKYLLVQQGKKKYFLLIAK